MPVDLEKLDPKQRSELLAALEDNPGFQVLRAIKMSKYAPIARDVLNGECKDMVEYKEKTAFLRALNEDQQIIDREVKKHRPNNGSAEASGSVIGGESV